MQDYDTEEEKLLKIIQIIQERHYQELKPWFNQLADIRARRVMPVQIAMAVEQMEAFKKWLDENKEPDKSS